MAKLYVINDDATNDTTKHTMAQIIILFITQ